MATNRELRTALLEKLGITHQALSQRVGRIKNRCPMSTEDATYVVAHRAGLTLDRFLNSEQVSHVRGLLGQLDGVQTERRDEGRSRKPAKNAPGPIVFPKEFKTSDPLLARAKVQEAREMASIYPIIYVLENSIRELVRRVMRSKYGLHWWRTEMERGKLKTIKNNAVSRMTGEEKQKWHQRRGADELDYVDLKDLGDTICAKYDVCFAKILGGKAWFEQFMRELYPSRCVLCHMNPLNSTNVKDLRLKMERWQQLVRRNLANIPK